MLTTMPSIVQQDRVPAFRSDEALAIVEKQLRPTGMQLTDVFRWARTLSDISLLHAFVQALVCSTRS
jgi:hypothetical protein